MNFFKALLILILLCLCVPIQADTTLTYSDIVHRMYDFRYLATPPIPGEKSGSITSTDPAAQYDAKDDRYLNWGADNDDRGLVRREGDSIVAADLTGPGVIWRIWSGLPQNGTIKIYIDGASQPVINRPFISMFDTTNGPFPFSELDRNICRGYNCFVPISYEKSCKIVLDKDWGRYYQITYSQFAPGTQVPSYTGTLSDDQKAALTNVNNIWAKRPMPAVAPGQTVIQKSYVIRPGKSVKVAGFDKPGAITGMICSVNETEESAMAGVLRDVALSISWDGESSPSVWSPLGDFFGSGPGFNPFSALPCGMTGGGMYSNWYMPFNKAVVKLSNDGSVSRTVAISIIYEDLKQPADNLLRFHAKWHRDNWGPGGVGRYAKDRWPDWPMLLANGGPGRYCGVALEVWNPLNSWDTDSAAKYVKRVSEICPDPQWFKDNVMSDYWWGEGDEKFFVDGEKFPSTFGTGSEDYFGFAWGTPQFFDTATQCQTLNHGNTGHIALARWHIADDIPFQRSFEGCIEKYHGDNWPLLYAVTAYWYQSPGSFDDYPALPIGDREGFYTLPTLAQSAP